MWNKSVDIVLIPGRSFLLEKRWVRQESGMVSGKPRKLMKVRLLVRIVLLNNQE